MTLEQIFLPIFRFAPVTRLLFFQNKLNLNTTHIRRTSRQILKTGKKINAISTTGSIGQENAFPLNFSLQHFKGGVLSSCYVLLRTALFSGKTVYRFVTLWWQEL
jgi:hypothetical protein